MLALIPGVSRSGATIVGGMVMGLDRPAAAEFSFFLAMPTMAAAFVARSAGGAATISAPSAALEIAVGFVMAFIASLVVVKPFLAFVRRVRLRAVRVVSHRRSASALLAALGGRVGVDAMQWLRRSFIAGFFVTVPLFISVAAFIWIFGVVDGLTTPLYDRLLGRRIPGPRASLTTAVAIVLVGAVATNVIGKRLLQRGES